MSECTWLSDRMPAVALGRMEWSPEELQHLSGCESCQREWELLRAADRLGDRLLPAFDARASSRTLLQRLDRSRKYRRRLGWGFGGMAAAAAIAALIWSDNPNTSPAVGPTPVVAALQIPLPELEGLQPAELDSVLRGIEQPAADDPALESPELRDLDSEELETVLDTWEG
jgi:hypothetical protein